MAPYTTGPWRLDSGLSIIASQERSYLLWVSSAVTIYSVDNGDVTSEHCGVSCVNMYLGLSYGMTIILHEVTAGVIPLRPKRNLVCSLIVRHSLQWRHNEHDGVSNQQPHDCLLNRLFRRRSTKTSKLRICAVTGEFPTHKEPVTRKMFPFDDGIMSRLDRTRKVGWDEMRSK